MKYRITAEKAIEPEIRIPLSEALADEYGRDSVAVEENSIVLHTGRMLSLSKLKSIADYYGVTGGRVFAEGEDRRPQKHVFIDWSEVDAGYGVQAPGYTPYHASPKGIAIRAHKPTVEAQPVITADRAWEDVFLNEYNTVWKVNGTYRLYYESFSDNGHQGGGYHFCVAFSQDGIHWEKPSLGICEFDGSTDNNILINCVMEHGFTVLMDPSAPEEERFKLIYTHLTTRKSGGWFVETYLSVSSDGLRFTKRGKILTGGDTQPSFFRDPGTGRYLIYTKQITPGGPARRTITRFEGDTLDRMKETGVVLYHDPLEPPDLDQYNSACQAWPGAVNAYMMLPSYYYHTRDNVNIHLLCSRDGLSWFQPLKEPWIDNSDSCLSMYAGCGILDKGDGIWSIFVGMNNHTHNNWGGCRSELHRVSIREDGFLSLFAEEEGEFCTSMQVIGPFSLVVNADIGEKGYLRVSVGNTEDALESIPGFSAAECRLVPCDPVHYRVEWSRPLSELEGQSVRFRFELAHTDLYSYSL